MTGSNFNTRLLLRSDSHCFVWLLWLVFNTSVCFVLFLFAFLFGEFFLRFVLVFARFHSWRYCLPFDLGFFVVFVYYHDKNQQRNKSDTPGYSDKLSRSFQLKFVQSIPPMCMLMLSLSPIIAQPIAYSYVYVRMQINFAYWICPADCFSFFRKYFELNGYFISRSIHLDCKYYLDRFHLVSCQFRNDIRSRKCKTKRHFRDFTCKYDGFSIRAAGKSHTTSLNRTHFWKTATWKSVLFFPFGSK